MINIPNPQRVELRSVGDLRPYQNNARIHDQTQLHALQRSFEEFGFLVPVLIDGDNNVICGHGRLEAAKLAGMEAVPCLTVEHLTPEQRRAFLLADNRLAECSRWDKALVSAELIRLRDVGYDLSITGFGEDDIILDLPQEPFEDDFDPTPTDDGLPAGSLWKLGEHRLLVGDATRAEDVGRLMGGEQADLLLTDPPYGVSYEGGTADALSIANDDLAGEEFVRFLSAAFQNARNAMRPGAVFYVWHPDGEPALEFRKALRATALPVRECLVWVKNSLVLSRQDYHWQHEPCLAGERPFEPCAYGWTGGAAHQWHSDRKQSTVLTFDRPVRSKEHPTMKPVKLFAYQIGNSTLTGERVLDPFAGSGTTLIACEQLKRRAFCMELDGGYADVIRRRWEALTGGVAERIDE